MKENDYDISYDFGLFSLAFIEHCMFLFNRVFSLQQEYNKTIHELEELLCQLEIKE